MSCVADDPETVRGLQERVARALPTEHVERIGGWWLRRSASPSWWMGTVLPHGADVGRDELVPMIAAAERFYAGFGAATTFQVSPGACAADLDATLAERGYRRHSPMSLQTASTVDVQAHGDGTGARLDEIPTSAWFAAWYAVHSQGSDPRIEWDMLARVNAPSAYASALDAGEVVAVGRAVADAGWAGVFGMATVPHARGRGAARSVLASLADWAAAEGASRMYLQVEADNEPALGLYERMRFTELCGYHYRSESPVR